MDLKITPSGQTIVKPTALGPVANTDTKLLIYGLFQKGRVLAQDGSLWVIAPLANTDAAIPYRPDDACNFSQTAGVMHSVSRFPKRPSLCFPVDMFPLLYQCRPFKQTKYRDFSCSPSCPKTRTEREARILEAFSKFAETSRRGTGSAIGDPEQTSPPDHPLRPACAPELLCGVAVAITEQAAQSFTTLHIPGETAHALVRFDQRVFQPLMISLCMIVTTEFDDCPPQRLFTEEDHPKKIIRSRHSLLIDKTNLST